jgi:hypothetical protein
MRLVLVLLAALCIVLSSTSAEAQTRNKPVYKIESKSCKASDSKQRDGSGFLVEDFRTVSASEDKLLVTALHVIYECKEIYVLKEGYNPNTSCTGDNKCWGVHKENEVVILAWPEYDMAAIVVPRETANGFFAETRPKRFGFGSTYGDLLSPEARVTIQGPSQYASRFEGFGWVHSTPTVKEQASHLKAHFRGASSAMQSMSGKASIILYLSDGAPGKSGAPVEIRKGGNEYVVGVHLAGYFGFPMSWAIRTTDLRNKLKDNPGFKYGRDHMDDPGWPRGFKPSIFSQASTPPYSESQHNYAERWKKRRLNFALGLMYERPFDDCYFCGSTGIYVDTYVELAVFPVSSKAHSFGLLFGLAYKLGFDEISLLSPYGTTLESDELFTHTVMANMGIGMKFFRTNSLFRPSFDVNFRFGSTYFKDIYDKTRMRWLWSVPLRVRLTFSPKAKQAIGVEFTLAIENSPEFKYKYTGVGDRTTQGGSSLCYVFGLGVRYEF